MDLPLLLIDIDGVISLFGFDPRRPPAGRLLLVDGVPHFLSSGAAEALGGLREHFELVWCSGWEEKADEYLPMALGLPAGLHHLTFGEPSASPASPGAGGACPVARHWKLEAIESFAGPKRALAWVDDAFDASCHEWALARSGPTELVETEAAVGLTAVHASHLRSWAGALR
jgi:hypothetical protein